MTLSNGNITYNVATTKAHTFTVNNLQALNAYNGTVGGNPTGKVYLGGAVGTIGTALLELNLDSAAKPGTTTWSTTSDARFKANIESANLDTCVQIVRDLDLKRFEWTQPIKDQVGDYRVLGWLAQDVKAYLPKSVTTANAYGVEDFHYLNADQLDKVMFGALKRSLALNDALEARVAALEARVAALESP